MCPAADNPLATPAASVLVLGDPDGRGWTAAVVVTRDDALALLCAHLRPDLPLWATVFDRTIAHRLRTSVPGVRLLSPAEMAAAELAEACLSEGVRPRPAGV